MFFKYIKRRMKECIFLLSICCIAIAAGCGLSAGEHNSEEYNLTEEQSQSAQGTSAQEEAYSEDIFAMDTYMTLTAYGPQAQSAIEKAKKEINRIEALVSTGISTSEIAKLNESGKENVSEDTEILIKKSLELYRSTSGAFDITVYPVMKLWGFTDENYKVPSKEELQAARSLMGADGVTLDEKTSEVSFLKNGMEIDLGGIAKGYTSGRVMELFKEEGVESAVISLGGNVQTLGTKTDGTKWRVAIENPDESEDYLGVVKVEDKAVITSGGYERYFEEDGKTYHHIIDPSTGYPAENGLSSVSIVSSDGTLADGLSTSLYIMGKEKALGYWREHSSEFDVILVEDDGSITISEGIKNDFTSDFSYDIAKKS